MLGQRITLQRKKLGISQTELARRLCISPSAVGMYEQGRREPSNDILVALSKELKVSTDYLLTGQDWPILKSSVNAMLICSEQCITTTSEVSVRTLSDEELKTILSSLLQES